MKRNCALSTILAMTLLFCIVATGFVSADAASVQEYTTTYDITADYMTEDPDTGELTLDSIPNSAIDVSNEFYANIASGYAGGFGAFVDAVTVAETLQINGDEYTYIFKVQCGSIENGMGYYAPEFQWKGTIVSVSDDAIEIAAPTSAVMTLISDGQFATNEEMIGFFGVNGYITTEETTDCPYPQVVSGDALLSMCQAGTFAVSDGSLGEFTAK